MAAPTRLNLIIERWDHLPWDHGFSTLSFAHALAARLDQLTLLCESHEGPLAQLALPENVAFHSLRGEQPRHSRRPRAFQTWVRDAVATGTPTLSLTPLVPADLWLPAAFPTLRSIGHELQRSSPYITFLKTRRWIGPRIAATRRVLRREGHGSDRTLFALDEPGAEHIRAHMQVRDITVIGRASGRMPTPDTEVVRARFRETLGIGPDTTVALLAASRPGSRAVRHILAGLAQARHSGADIELVTMGFRQHGVLLEADRLGIAGQVHTMGATSRMDVLYAAADVALLPSTPTGPLDESMIADAIASHCAVIAGRHAPGASLVTEDVGLTIDDAGPEAWCNALQQGASTPTDAADSVDINTMITRLLDA